MKRLAIALTGIAISYATLYPGYYILARLDYPALWIAERDSYLDDAYALLSLAIGIGSIIWFFWRWRRRPFLAAIGAVLCACAFYVGFLFFGLSAYIANGGSL